MVIMKAFTFPAFSVSQHDGNGIRIDIEFCDIHPNSQKVWSP
jgi:hypothetical protein